MPLFSEGVDWSFTAEAHALRYTDRHGTLTTPAPALAGMHQYANLALAIAMVRHQDRVTVSPRAFEVAATATRWPARMQRLVDGPLNRRLPDGAEIWLDGGHNAAAALAVADAATKAARGRPVHLILGMLANKDMGALIDAFAPIAASLTAVPVPGHEHHAPAAIARVAADAGVPATAVAGDVGAALDHIAAGEWHGPALILILGSLYLAGEVLALNDEAPD